MISFYKIKMRVNLGDGDIQELPTKRNLNRNNLGLYL